MRLSIPPVLKAAQLLDARQWAEACRVLEPLVSAGREDPLLLRMLMDAYQELNDWDRFCWAGECLLQIEGPDPDVLLALASSHLQCWRPILGLANIEEYLAQFPDHPEAENARELLRKLRGPVEELLEQLPLQESERHELAKLHEQVLAAIQIGHYQTALELARRLHASCPEFVPAINNLAVIYFALNRLDDSLEFAQRALDTRPDNCHALGQTIQMLLLTGREDEVQPLLERLRAAKPAKPDDCVKLAETYSVLGDDEGVIRALQFAERSGMDTAGGGDIAYLYHLAGVAHVRQGRPRDARRCWRQALKLHPALTVAKENLADCDQPVALRHGGWPFELPRWLPGEVVKYFRDHWLDAVDDELDSERLDRDVLREFPMLDQVVPILLDRGDPAGRTMAVRLACAAGTPPMHEALRAFCLSQRGPDALRLDAARHLQSAGQLTSPQRIWIEGAWRDIELMLFTISEESLEAPLPPEVEPLAAAAVEALNQQDGAAAEPLLLRCIEAIGETPMLLNNLALAYSLQDRVAESGELIDRIGATWPDYFFGRIILANIAIDESRFEDAMDQLRQLQRRTALHISEFRALCRTHIRLASKRKCFQAAERWLETWEGVEPDPDHPELVRVRARLQDHSLLHYLAILAGVRPGDDLD
jgi:tetratricopeptide (TPR) repeat protein